MTDLPPMDRCPVRRTKGHALAAIVPATGKLDMTLYCERCGAMRRVPVTGRMVPADRLDDAVRQADAIVRGVG